MLRKIEVSIQEAIETRALLEKDKEMRGKVADKEYEIGRIQKDRKTEGLKVKQKEKERLVQERNQQKLDKQMNMDVFRGHKGPDRSRKPEVKKVETVENNFDEAEMEKIKYLGFVEEGVQEDI